MTHFLYTLIIYPLILIIETAYQLVYEIFGNTGGAVLGVSLAVSLLCLPLYIVAEKWQQTERNKQKEMEAGIQRIKKTFKGDEQYMILTAFYRQHHYHPLMALRSSFGLLIQVPFFIAAYSFLSALPALQEKSFWFIRDMGKADALFYIKNFPVNILPIAMTVINIAGSAVYTKGFKLKDKVPIYVMALIFLAILYTSPAGLVLYWTMNNVFSLVKNIFYKIKKPLFVLYIISCAAALAGITYVLAVHNGLFSKRIVMAAILSLVFFTPLAVKACKWLLGKPLKIFVDDKNTRHTIYILSAISLALLTGTVIPSYAISSSVVEFMGIDGIANPNTYLFNSTVQAAGIFVFWFFCIYFLFGKKIQSILAAVSLIMFFCGSANAFLFSGDYGTLNSILVFDKGVSNLPAFIAVNLAVLILIILAILILTAFSRPQKIFVPICSIMMISFFAIGTVNISKIQNEYKALAKKQVQESDKIEPFYHLSKNGKNVVVIMADRAENSYIEPILNAYPELKESFKDFTLYTHTLSYDIHTLLGAPPLYGGYEYTPLEMNKRDSVALKTKNNEALLMMPRVFTEQAGFEAQCSDLSWANYQWVADMSICEDYPKISGSNIERRYTSKWISDHPECVQKNAASNSIKRNFLWFAVFKQSPVFLRESLYDDGNWWASNQSFADMINFLAFYSALDYMPELTDFKGNDTGAFILIENSVTHSSIDLQAPDFVPVKKVTDRGPFSDLSNYDCLSSNAALLRRIAEWTDYLKKNNCYNNTRIIIAADHGIGLSDEIAQGFFDYDSETSNNPDHNHPLLMVKDFTQENSGNHFTMDDSFMTNADVPYIAFKDIIERPVNPFTNKEIVRRIENTAYGVCANGHYDPGQNGIYKYDFNGVDIFDVKDDMSKLSNWKAHK